MTSAPFLRSRILKARQLARTFRPNLEPLESRLLLAFDLALSSSATVGVNISTVGSTTTYEAVATGANIRLDDIQAELVAGRNVVVDSGSTGSEAGNITLVVSASLANTAGASLTLQTGAGATLADILLSGLSLTNAGS